MQLDRTGHRFFDPLVAFLCNHIGVTLSLLAHRRGHWRPIEPGLKGGLGAVATGITLWYEIASILDPIERGDWPERLELIEEPLPVSGELPKEKISRTGRVNVVSCMAMFIQYFDSIEDLAATRQSDPTVRFARNVRNFAAHGGEIRGVDSRSSPLRWRSLEWTTADNGKPLLHGDVSGIPGLTGGDLVVLMRDLDALI
jgi:hypothetical protein